MSLHSTSPTVSLVGPDAIQKALDSIDEFATITPDAKEVLSRVFNFHSELALRTAYQGAANRASYRVSEELLNAKHGGVIDIVTDPPSSSPIELLRPFDTSTQLTVDDIMKPLTRPDGLNDINIDYQQTPEETRLLGPIKSFSSGPPNAPTSMTKNSS